jgi:tRNA synthetases class I (M)
MTDGLVVRGVHPDIHQNRIICDLGSEPLEDLSISRPRERIGWGIAVPDDPTQTVYVWFDALLVYLSGIGYPENGVTWPPDVQVIGKDIVRFVAVCHMRVSLTFLKKLSCGLFTCHSAGSQPSPTKNAACACSLDCEPEKDVQVSW